MITSKPPGGQNPMAGETSRGVPASDAGTSGCERNNEGGVVAPDAQRALEQLRDRLAAEIRGRQDDRATARQSLNRAQDLDAELFRLREQLTLSHLEVEEKCARILDLEAQVGVRGEQREVLLKDLAERNLQLSQAMALHQEDATRWHRELDMARQAYQQEATRWQGELELARQAHQHDATRWQGELELARQAHQHDATRWRTDLEQAKQAHLRETAEALRATRLERDLALTESQRQKMVANEAWRTARQALGLELDQARDSTNANAAILGDVLSSRSWRLTKPLRRFVEWARGRRWVEPEMPTTAWDSAPRAVGHEQHDE